MKISTLNLAHALAFLGAAIYYFTDINDLAASVLIVSGYALNLVEAVCPTIDVRHKNASSIIFGLTLTLCIIFTYSVGSYRGSCVVEIPCALHHHCPRRNLFGSL